MDLEQFLLSLKLVCDMSPKLCKLNFRFIGTKSRVQSAIFVKLDEFDKIKGEQILELFELSKKQRPSAKISFIKFALLNESKSFKIGFLKK